MSGKDVDIKDVVLPQIQNITSFEQLTRLKFPILPIARVKTFYGVDLLFHFEDLLKEFVRTFEANKVIAEMLITADTISYEVIPEYNENGDIVRLQINKHYPGPKESISTSELRLYDTADPQFVQAFILEGKSKPRPSDTVRICRKLKELHIKTLLDHYQNLLSYERQMITDLNNIRNWRRHLLIMRSDLKLD